VGQAHRLAVNGVVPEQASLTLRALAGDVAAGLGRAAV
jgi:hypothetical protein